MSTFFVYSAISWRRAFVALFLCGLPMLGSCAQRFGGGTGTVVDAATGQPMAGVHVVLYIMSSGSTGPFPSSSTICGPDYYTVSDDKGNFTIPEDALDLPWRFSLSPRIPSFNARAYKAGYVDAVRVEGITYFNDEYKKTGPVKVLFKMIKDDRSPGKRSDYLDDLTVVGCRCGEMHAQIIIELREVGLTLSKANIEADRTGKPRIGTVTLGRRCRS